MSTRLSEAGTVALHVHDINITAQVMTSMP